LVSVYKAFVLVVSSSLYILEKEKEEKYEKKKNTITKIK